MCNKIKRQIPSFLLAITYIIATLGCGGAHYHMGEELAPKPIEKDKNYQISHLATEKVTTQPIITSKGGHKIEFLDDQLKKVRIQENLPYPFSRELILPVYKEDFNLSLKDILVHGAEWHKNNLRIHFPTSSQRKGHLYIGSMLRGGGGGNSKCQYREDEAEWDPKRGRWMCPALNHPRNEPRQVRMEREAAHRKEEERKREQEEYKKREEARLKMDQDDELAYQKQKQASEARSQQRQNQMQQFKAQEEKRLSDLAIEEQRLEERWIKEQQARDAEDELAMKELEQILANDQVEEDQQEYDQLQIPETTDNQLGLSGKLQNVQLQIKQIEDLLAQQQSTGAMELEKQLTALIKQKEAIEQIYALISLEEDRKDTLEEKLEALAASVMSKAEKELIK